MLKDTKASQKVTAIQKFDTLNNILMYLNQTEMYSDLIVLHILSFTFLLFFRYFLFLHFFNFLLFLTYSFQTDICV